MLGNLEGRCILMASREEVQAFMNQLYSSIPRSFYHKLEATQRGFGFVLNYLEKTDGEVIAGDLAKKLNVSTARIAALLKKMERCGYVTRHRSKEDGRRTVVEITPAGVSYINELREQAFLRVEKLFASVSKEDLETYIRISQQIRKAMDE